MILGLFSPRVDKDSIKIDSSRTTVKSRLAIGRWLYCVTRAYSSFNTSKRFERVRARRRSCRRSSLGVEVSAGRSRFTLTRVTTCTTVTWAGHNAGCGFTSDTPRSRPILVHADPGCIIVLGVSGRAHARARGAPNPRATPTRNGLGGLRVSSEPRLEFHRFGNTAI